MPNLKDYKKSDKGIFLLIKGTANTGKSTAAMSFPNCVVLDFDNKMPSVAMKHYPNREDISWENFNDTFELSNLLEKWQKGDCPYDTIICDSVTSAAGLCLRTTGMVKGETLFTRLKETEAQVLADKKAGKKGAAVKDYVQPIGMDYYNTETAFFCTFLLDALKNIWVKGYCKNIIVIAHILEYESSPALNTGAITKTKSILTVGRKPATWIPTQFDDMFTFVIETKPFTNEGGIRKCYTVNKGEEDSRTTLNLPDAIELDGNGTFYGKIRSSLGER